MAERITVNSKKPIPIKENLISHRRKTDFRSDDSPVNRILYLQRTIGNQAVQRLIKSWALQTKLIIGQPGDKYEQEADRVADAVMRMPEPGMQRQVDEEEEEEILQTKPLVDQITPVVQRQVEEEEKEEMLQAKSREDATPEVSNDLESKINAIKGGGRPLAESERAYFERRFGYDFGQVRMHKDTRAAESARAINAKAYTLGHDIIFGAGLYAPETGEGQRLLAHELTHVVQQKTSEVPVLQTIPASPQPQIVSGFTATGTPRTQPSVVVFEDGPDIDTHAHFPQFEWRAHITMSGANTNCFEAGFLQTITKSELHATYSSGDQDLSHSTCSFVIPKLPIRDGDSESTTWFTGFTLLGTCELAPRSMPLPPGISRTLITSTTSKRMSDDPGGPFPVKHSDNRKKLLRKIEETIDFNTWLAVKQRTLPQNDVKSYHFLKNARWVLKRRTVFSHYPSGIGFRFTQNQVTLKSFGDGQGGSAPTLDLPVAGNESNKICKL